MAKTIADYKKDYADAAKRGDAAGMKAANDGANAIRAQTGQKQEYASEHISQVQNSNKGGSAGGGGSSSRPSSSTPSSSSKGSGGGGGGSSGSSKYGGGIPSLDAALKKYSDAYASARAAGDVSGMRAANDAANQLRNQYGYAAEDASRDIESIKAQTGYYGSGGGGGIGGSGGGGGGQPNYPYQFGSIDEMKEAMGYDKVSAAEQAAIDAYIKQTVSGLEGQKSGITQSADDAARQAYISYMQSQATLPQALAASGYSGGMADSQRIALDANLQNAQKDILLNRDNALNDVDTAIQQAKLEGSIQGAQSQAQLGRDAISAYQQYIQQQNAYQNQDFWTKYGYDWQGGQASLDRQHQSDMQTGSQQWQSGENQANREWQTGESQADRDQTNATNTRQIAYEKAWNMLLAGALPDDGTLTAAGISRAEAEQVVAQIRKQLAGKGGGGSKTTTTGPSGDTTTTPPAGGVTQAQYNAAADRFDSGDYSPEVIETMLAAGDRPYNLAKAAGFGDINDLGYGPIDNPSVAQKLVTGEVEAINIGGTLFYRRTGQGSYLPSFGGGFGALGQ